MPTYTYKCPLCGLTHAAFRRMDQRDEGPTCPRDAAAMHRVPDAPMGRVDGPAVPKGS